MQNFQKEKKYQTSVSYTMYTIGPILKGTFSGFNLTWSVQNIDPFCSVEHKAKFWMLVSRLQKV